MARMNILVYAGQGTTVESVRHCIYSLRRLVSPHFAVNTVTSDTIINEPWTASCALLVIPGGADLGYCRVLNGEGNRRIAQFVRRGGAYLGFCAGGYYGSGKVEFEVGNGPLEVVGGRELAFFPGTCRGATFKGFQYASEDGARAAEVKVNNNALCKEAPESLRCYYNGGGVFVDAGKYKEKGVEILASYAEGLDVDGGEENAAVVYCKVGDGGVILTGPHPEFAGINLDKKAGGEDYAKLIQALLDDEEQRTNFLRACLIKLGLNVSENTSRIPALSQLHLTSIYPRDVEHIYDRLKDITIFEGECEKIVDENDTFVLHKSPDSFSMSSLSDALDAEDTADRIVDYNKIEKHVLIHENGYPGNKDVPYFNHDVYYQSLKEYRSQSRSSLEQFGSFLLYGEVVTSTNTLLDKNFNLLQRLPSGLTAVATVQVAGRGRGSNVWVSPMGALVFSTCLRHPLELGVQAPVVFVQYLVALAIVEGIKTYGQGYREMPVRLKWPNDIYAEDPAHNSVKSDREPEKGYVKVGGILVNSSYADNQFHLVVGCGINTTNRAPTTSLNLILEALNLRRKAKGVLPLPAFEQEKLLAKILVVFEEMYDKFRLLGFKPFEELYYRHWLHSNQIVRLEMEGGSRARIRGITMDFGLLRADEVDRDDRVTGRVFTLQSDNNSFDFLKGLLKKKT
ncbi:biotin holocarboxylase synthetase [Rhizina undulata]